MIKWWFQQVLKLIFSAWPQEVHLSLKQLVPVMNIGCCGRESKGTLLSDGQMVFSTSAFSAGATASVRGLGVRKAHTICTCKSVSRILSFYSKICKPQPIRTGFNLPSESGRCLWFMFATCQSHGQNQ